ncbi:hypothetical protein ABTL82_19195, partial [Acinetobacter baumannii]
MQPYHAVLLATFALSALAGHSARWLAFFPERWRLVGLLVLCLLTPLAALRTLVPAATMSLTLPDI